jgi:general stress protein YciG
MANHCMGKTNSGKPCRAAATEGGLCFFHGNPDKVSELGRKGGRSSHRGIPQSVDPLPTLDTAVGVRDTVARLIADMYSGKLRPNVAVGLASLLSLQLRAIEKIEVQGRIAEMQEQLRKLLSIVEKSDPQRMAPQRADWSVDPEVPQATEA